MQYSIVDIEEVLRNPDIRIDADYYHPEFIKNSKLITSDKKIRDFISSNIQNIKSSPINKDFDYLEISNIALDSCNYATTKIQHGEEPDRAHYILKKNDIAISTVRPNRNAVALIQKDGIIGSSGLSILRADNIEPEYFFAFCKTNYFIKNLMRANKASMYPAVSNYDVLNTPLFIPHLVLKTKIVNFVKNSFIQAQKEKETYIEAEKILLSELGLIDWQPKHCLTFVKNYSDVQKAERMDADYFQPKYDEIVNAIKNYVGGYSTIGKEFKQNKIPCEIDADKMYRYVEIGSVNVSNGEITPSEVLGADLPENAKRILNKNDVIVSRVRTYRGAVTIIEEQGYVGSGAFTVLAENGRVKKETLLAFLRSKPLLAWSLKPNTGTSYPVIIDDDILNLPIPILPEEKQNQIQQKITESFNLRKKSKHLLECAKRAVEIAIEKDEKEALSWLESQTKEI